MNPSEYFFANSIILSLFKFLMNRNAQVVRVKTMEHASKMEEMITNASALVIGKGKIAKTVRFHFVHNKLLAVEYNNYQLQS